MKYVLRPYQSDGVERIRGAFGQGARSVLYVLPTGGGKTPIFCHITELASAKGNDVLILVHRRELLLQASRSLSENGVPHGLVAPGFSPNGHRVQIGSVQTVIRRLDRIRPPSLIVLDEGHHAAASSWEKIVRAYPNARHLGVTATPCRLDGRGLGKAFGGLYDALIVGPSIRQLMDQDYLSPADVYAPPTDLDLTGVRTQMGDFDHKEVDRRVDKPVITGCAVEHYRRLADGKPAIAFCASIRHAQHVAEEFRAAGYMSVAVDGTMAERDRDLAVRGLATGSITVLTACEIISEGVDVPIVTVGILLRPTQSTALFLQQVGRILRPGPGKTAIILDHVGNCLRHGLPNEDREWGLDGDLGGKRRKKDPDEMRIRQCPKCYTVHAISPSCPKCGYEYKATGRLIEEVGGQLKKLTPDQLNKRKAYIARRMEQGRSQTLNDLIAAAKERGYSVEWAKHVWRARERKANERKANHATHHGPTQRDWLQDLSEQRGNSYA